MRRFALAALAAITFTAGAALGANEVKWETAAPVADYLTTELDSLASAGNKLGAAIDNRDGSRFLAVQIHVATQGSARSASAHFAVYLIPTVDDSVYFLGDDALDPPATFLVCSAPLDAATTARDTGCWNIALPGLQFKLLIENNTGQALAASGNTVDYVLSNEELQ